MDENESGHGGGNVHVDKCAENGVRVGAKVEVEFVDFVAVVGVAAVAVAIAVVIVAAIVVVGDVVVVAVVEAVAEVVAVVGEDC